MTTTADTIMELADEYASEAMGGGYPDADESTRSALRTAVESLVAERDALRTAAENVITCNRDHARDQYGDENKAETWACVVALRAALRGQP